MLQEQGRACWALLVARSNREVQVEAQMPAQLRSPGHIRQGPGLEPQQSQEPEAALLLPLEGIGVVLYKPRNWLWVRSGTSGAEALGSGLQDALCMVICALFRGNGRFTAFSPQPPQPQDLGSGQVSLFSLFPASRPWSNSSYLQN